MQISVTSNMPYITDNALSSKNERRALNISKIAEIQSSSNAPYITTKEFKSTNKVKRKTNESTFETTSETFPDRKPTNLPSTMKTSRSTERQILTTLLEKSTDTVTEDSTVPIDGTVKILINGTINCTAELSSTSELLNRTNNEILNLEKLTDAQPRIPIVNIDRMDAEDHTFNPNEIITDKSVNAGFDENDMFTINVTSSLRANTSHPTSIPGSVISISGPSTLNTSKKTKQDYDYDYNEPTLPPSLPNLK